MTKKGVVAALSDFVKTWYQCSSGSLNFISEKKILLACPQSAPLPQISLNFARNCCLLLAINFFLSKWMSIFSSPGFPKDVALGKDRIEFDFSPLPKTCL